MTPEQRARLEFAIDHDGEECGMYADTRAALAHIDALDARLAEVEGAWRVARQDAEQAEAERDEWDSKCQALQVAVRNLTETFAKVEAERDRLRAALEGVREAVALETAVAWPRIAQAIVLDAIDAALKGPDHE